MRILDLAVKDLRILLRDKIGAFFILGFPILMGLFFGMVMGGMSSGGRGKMEIAIIDQDNSEISRKFIDELGKQDGIRLVPDELGPAMESVRLGRRTGLLVVPPKFGETAGVFWETQPEMQLGMDPSRAAESAMMQGFIMKSMSTLLVDRFQDPTQFMPKIQDAKAQLLASPEMSGPTRLLVAAFFDSLETMIGSADQLQANSSVPGFGGGGEEDGGAEMELQFANIKPLDLSRPVDPNSVAAQVQKLRSRWDISFPQAILWGVLGCVAGFSISIAKERAQGTLVRLQASPLSKLQILLGKALACFLAALLVMTVMVALGMMLQMRPGSFPKLIAASLATAVCFVGIMMTVSLLGRTEQSVSGSGWAINMVMAMLGGCMIPVMFMPEFLQTLSVVSPIRWSILAIEGAIWRQFSWSEMFAPCAILVVIGTIGFGVGTTLLQRRT